MKLSYTKFEDTPVHVELTLNELRILDTQMSIARSREGLNDWKEESKLCRSLRDLIMAVHRESDAKSTYNVESYERLIEYEIPQKTKEDV